MKYLVKFENLFSDEEFEHVCETVNDIAKYLGDEKNAKWVVSIECLTNDVYIYDPLNKEYKIISRTKLDELFATGLYLPGEQLSGVVDGIPYIELVLKG